MPNNISYVVEGKGDVILFLHGWGQSKESMIPLIENLKNNYKCVLLDMPGFGNSCFNNTKNIKEYTQYIRKFLIENNIIPKYIVGHSFGGKVAVEYYLEYKDVEKLFIIASPILKPKRNLNYYYKIIKYKLKKHLKIKSNEGSYDYKNCKESMKSFFVSVVNTHYDKLIKNIEIPTILIWGKNDEKVPIKKAYKLDNKLKNSELYIINGDHFAYIENIEFTKLVIQKHLRRNNNG